MSVRWLQVVALALSSGCGVAAAFPCDASSQCLDAGVAGVCQADGWCSFPDDGCASGQRYGAHAGDDMAGLCVGDPGTTGANDSETGDAEGESVDPTLATFDATGPVADGEAEAEATGSVDEGTTSEVTATTATTATTTTASDAEAGGSEASDDGSAQEVDDGTEAECGNGVVEGVEACDGMDLDEEDCDSLDAGIGVPTCDAMCQFDLSTCEPVDTEGYDPCDVDRDCPEMICHVFAGNGTCLPHCDVDDDCPSPTDAEDPICSVDRFCLLPCVDDSDCPELMRCDVTEYGNVCLF